MDRNKINDALYNLYNTEPVRAFRKDLDRYNQALSGERIVFSGIYGKFESSHIDGLELTNMYLLSASDAYMNSPFKIMVVGRETLGWGDESNGYKDGAYSSENSIMSLMDLYFEHTFVNKGSNSTFHKFVEELSFIIDSKLGIKHQFIFNNIAKIAYVYYNIGFDPNINNSEIVKELFQKELEILKPDMLLFMTGIGKNNLDSYIQDRLCVDFEDVLQLDNNLLISELKSKDKSNPLAFRAFRLNHPTAISFKGNYIKSQIFDKLLSIVGEMKKV